jgi:hypothetical protein
VLTSLRAPRGAATARLCGCLLLLVFAGLSRSSNGFHVTFLGSQTSSSPGELNLWLSHVLLVIPAALLIGYGSAPAVGRSIERLMDAASRLTPRERRLALLAVCLLAAAAARIGRAVFLLDLPVTDDEYAVDFGGRVLASGHVLTHLGLSQAAVPDLFLYYRDGAVGSFDWIGAQAAAAAAYVTHLGAMFWALLAALPIAPIAILMYRRTGIRGAVAAVAIFCCSPMVALLSMTTHTHIASRAAVALALLAFWQASRLGGLRRWALVGAWLGAAFLCRPFEVVFLSAPIVGVIVYQTIRHNPAYRMALPGAILGGAAFAAVFFWHAAAMTGHPLLPARLDVPANTDIMAGTLWTRLGDNVGYNTLMLAVWFLGPIGIALIAVGVLNDWFTKVLALCVVSDLCLAFFHDNPGLHIVGPIHYSECAVPLAIIATHGAMNIVAAARRLLGEWRVVAAPLAVALSGGLGVLTMMQAVQLRDQAVVQRTLVGGIEGAAQADKERAVVLTPWMFAVVSAIPAFGQTGTWVHDWPRPQLDLGDQVLFVRDTPAVEREVRARFPDRRLFRLRRTASMPPTLELAPLNGGKPVSLASFGNLAR